MPGAPSASPLAERQPREFLADAENAALIALQGDTICRGHCGEMTEWLLKHVGDPVIPKLAAIMATAYAGCGEYEQLTSVAVKLLGNAPCPFCDPPSNREEPTNEHGLELHHDLYYVHYLKLLLPIKETQDDELIVARIRLLMGPPYRGTQADILFDLALTSRIPAAIELVASYLEHSAKTKRRLAAQALATLGDAALPQAPALPGHPKAELRETGIALLTAIDSPRARELLRSRLAEESTAKLCDLIRKALLDESPAPETRKAPNMRRSS